MKLKWQNYSWRCLRGSFIDTFKGHIVLIMGYGYLIHISMENIIVNKLAPISTRPVEIFYLDYLYIWTRKSRENEKVKVDVSDRVGQSLTVTCSIAWSQGQLHSLKVAYVGESGFSGSHRLTTEHRPDITRGDLSNAFAKHAAAAHPDRARDPGLYKVKVLGTFGTCIDRQVAEGCELAYPADPDQKWMNSREEWHQPSLNRVTVTREVRQPRRNSNNTGNSSRRPGRN